MAQAGRSGRRVSLLPLAAVAQTWRCQNGDTHFCRCMPPAVGDVRDTDDGTLNAFAQTICRGDGKRSNPRRPFQQPVMISTGGHHQQDRGQTFQNLVSPRDKCLGHRACPSAPHVRTFAAVVCSDLRPDPARWEPYNFLHHLRTCGRDDALQPCRTCLADPFCWRNFLMQLTCADRPERRRPARSAPSRWRRCRQTAPGSSACALATVAPAVRRDTTAT